MVVRRPRAVRVAVASALAAFLALLVACPGSSHSHANAGVGLLSASINPRMVPPPTQSDYEAAFDQAYAGGVRAVTLTWTWSALEPTPNSIDVSDVANSISYLVAKGFRVYVGIQPINTVKREVPSDLAAVAWDDPAMRDRLHALIDALAPATAGAAEYLSIGNEVDVYLAQTGEWAAWQTLYDDAVAYAHQQMPGTKVGVTSTFAGLVGSAGADIVAMNLSSDVLILTYYPLQGDFQVRAPDAPVADFAAMVQAAAGKQVVLQEVGYPSGAANGSSEALQAQFATAALAQWRAHGAAMPFLSWFLLHDLDATTCDTLAQYYGLAGDPAFVSYLCTLGLRHDDDADKPAWDAFVAGAK